MKRSKVEKPNLPHVDANWHIDMRRQAAMHYQQVAKFLLEAAAFHETGDVLRGDASTIKAHGERILADECENENFKRCALGYF